MRPSARASAAGLTLIELVAFILISAIVLEAMAAIMARAFRDQFTGLAQSHLQSVSSFLAKRLDRDVSMAQTIRVPLRDGYGIELEGYIGRAYAGASGWINPGTGDTSGTYDRFYYCVDRRRHLHYYYDARVAGIATDPPSISCGQAGGELLVDAPLEITGNLSGTGFSGAVFGRRASTPNIVDASFDVNRPAMGAHSPLTNTTQMSILFQSSADPPP